MVPPAKWEHLHSLVNDLLAVAARADMIDVVQVARFPADAALLAHQASVHIVGDALMDMYELMEKRYDYRTGEAKWSGLDQIKRFCEHYDHLIWLNPEEPPRWGGYWGESYGYIARAVDMYPLTVDGLERGMKKLLVNR